jgi:hypothetical protein
MGELVNHTSEAALKPYVVKITGPLLRAVGDRLPGMVKKSIVETLRLSGLSISSSAAAVANLGIIRGSSCDHRGCTPQDGLKIQFPMWVKLIQSFFAT